MQGSPSTHGPQTPLWQTPLVPHATPSLPGPASLQLGVAPQVHWPIRQGSGSAQTSPGRHETQAPPKQRSAPPQDVLSATGPSSTQAGTPSKHAITPVSQGDPALSTQLAPALHAGGLPGTQVCVARRHAAPGQSLSVRQPTHAFVPGSQCGVVGVAAQIAELQRGSPATQRFATVSQTGVAPAQSELERQITHWWLAGSQAGIAPGQSALVVHTTPPSAPMQRLDPLQ